MTHVTDQALVATTRLQQELVDRIVRMIHDDEVPVGANPLARRKHESGRTEPAQEENV